MKYCNHDCNEGRNCPLRTRNGGESVDCDPISKIDKAADVVLAVVIGALAAVALVSWWSA